MPHTILEDLRIDATYVLRRAAKMTPAELWEVLDKRAEIEQVFAREALLAPLADDAQTLLGLLEAVVAKNFTDLKFEDLSIAVFGLHYVLSPVDIIPDSVEAIGYADDAAVMEQATLLIGHVLERYRAKTA